MVGSSRCWDIREAWDDDLLACSNERLSGALWVLEFLLRGLNGVLYGIFEFVATAAYRVADLAMAVRPMPAHHVGS